MGEIKGINTEFAYVGSEYYEMFSKKNDVDRNFPDGLEGLFYDKSLKCLYHGIVVDGTFSCNVVSNMLFGNAITIYFREKFVHSGWSLKGLEYVGKARIIKSELKDYLEFIRDSDSERIKAYFAAKAMIERYRKVLADKEFLRRMSYSISNL